MLISALFCCRARLNLFFVRFRLNSGPPDGPRLLEPVRRVFLTEDNGSRLSWQLFILDRLDDNIYILAGVTD